MIIKADYFYYQELLKVIKEISDIHFQKKIWIKGEGPECSSYCDIVDFFFQFYKGARNLDSQYAEYGLTKEQHRKLKALYEKFDSYLDISPENDEEVIQDPRWHEIIALAKDVYADLGKNPKLEI